VGHQPFQGIGQVGFVVGGEAQFRPRLQHPGKLVQHRGLQKTAFVVPGLGPGVREQQKEPAQRGIGQGGDDIPSVPFINPNIVKRMICQLCQQLGDTHFIGLGANQADVRVLIGQLK